jgi:choice-of-anchor A domain-containing protein
MKIIALCFTTLLVSPMIAPGVSGIGWPKWGSKNNDKRNTDVVPTVVNSETIENIIQNEKRFVLYNSRRLIGECLPICYEPTPAPIAESITEPPVTIRTQSPTTASPTSKPTEAPTTASPTSKPTGFPTVGATEPAPVPTPGGVICEDFTPGNNLGFGYSEASHNPSLGNNHYGMAPGEECYPKVMNMGDLANPLINGYDDSVAFFVGGSYKSVASGEIEGNIVVLGDFSRGSNGPWNLATAGEGTQVIPHRGGNCVVVGGDFDSPSRIEIYTPTYKCAVIVKGNAKNAGTIAPKWMKDMGFSYGSYPNFDLSEYEHQKERLIAKSEYWATLPATPNAAGVFSSPVFNFNCSPDDVIQVFHVTSSDLSKGGIGSYLFNKHCNDKTILINVHGAGNYKVQAKIMNWVDDSGKQQAGGHQGFPSCMNSALLWNFFEVDTLTMGGGNSGSDEWQGSILVNGNLNMYTSGQSGRTMVIGDIVHNSPGSEFHSFEFKPPKPLPDIDCDDLTPGERPPVPAPVHEPAVPAPIPAATDEPVPATDAPVVPAPDPVPPVDPGTFCHALNDRSECGLTGPGSCAVQPGPRSEKYPDGTPSCGIGVPVGYYPDLTRCDAYCYCTGTAAPSRYEIVNVGNLYDHKLASASYLNGKWGKNGGNGAYGTTGGIPVSDKGGMSVEGTKRPPGCAPVQTCNKGETKFKAWNQCKEYYQCVNGISYPTQKCGTGTLFDEKISACNHDWAVDCKI